MSLNYNLTNVSDKANREKSEAIIFMCMAVGMPGITEKNYEEFYNHYSLQAKRVDSQEETIYMFKYLEGKYGAPLKFNLTNRKGGHMLKPLLPTNKYQYTLIFTEGKIAISFLISRELREEVLQSIYIGYQNEVDLNQYRSDFFNKFGKQPSE